MNRLIAESLACIMAALFFMCGFLLGGVRLGMLGFYHGMREGEKNEREKQRIKSL